MKSTPEIWMSGKFVIFRHAVSIVCFFISWKLLQRWYYFQHPGDYLLFALLACAGFIIAASPFLLKELRTIPRNRILACLPLLLLLLPWGEWLSLGTIFTRENWSEMLFRQGLFIYGCVLLLRICPSFAKWLSNGFLKLLEIGSRQRSLLWSAPVFLFVLTAWIALFFYRETPVVQDSAAHLFQAQIFKNFKLFAPVPSGIQESFTGPLDLLIMQDGRWFGIYFPGYAALMAPAAQLNLQWLVAPVLAALTCAIWILYAQRWHSRRTAILLGWLLAISPFIVVMSSTVMVFTPELFFASAVIFLLRHTLEKPSLLALACLSIGIVGIILVRSFSLLPFLGPVFVYCLFQAFRKKLFRIPFAIFCGFAIGISLLFLYQQETTGNGFKSGYTIEFPDIGWGFGKHFIGVHSPLKAIDNVSNNLLGLNHWVGGWYSGSLLFVLAFFWRQKLQTWDQLFLAGCCLLMTFYFFFFFQDLFFGPRYYYVFTPIILLFVVRSITEKSIGSRFEPALLIPLLVLTIVISVPKTLPAFVKRYDPSKTQSGKLKEQIRINGDKPTIVFLDKHAGQDFVNWNDPFLRSNIIFARDLEDKNAEVQKFFPNHRPVWFRMISGFEKGNITGGYQFSSEPDRSPSGTLSLFDLSMALQAARDYPKQDFFDICYIDIFNVGYGRENFEFLDNVEKTPLQGGEYKRVFRRGIAHAGKMLLLPMIAFDEHGHDWKLGFDPSEFRKEFDSARSDFVQAGEIGRSILGQMDKVKNRIDRNSDQQLSDSEINIFLVEKMKLVTMGASL
jgi:hypothetical protein